MTCGASSAPETSRAPAGSLTARAAAVVIPSRTLACRACPVVAICRVPNGQNVCANPWRIGRPRASAGAVARFADVDSACPSADRTVHPRDCSESADYDLRAAVDAERFLEPLRQRQARAAVWAIRCYQFDSRRLPHALGGCTTRGRYMVYDGGPLRARE